MKIFKRFVFAAFLIIIPWVVSGQILDPVSWSFEKEQIEENTYELRFKATMDEGWHMYGLNIPEGGPIATSVNFDDSEKVVVEGSPIPNPKPKVKHDPSFDMELELFSKEVVLTQRINRNTSEPFELTGYIEYMSCDDSRCLPPTEEEFSFSFDALEGEVPMQNQAATTGGSEETVTADESVEEQVPTRIEIDQDTAESEITSSEEPAVISTTEQSAGSTDGTGSSTLWGTFIIAILAGFGGLLTPCVYPMIPMTVSFFMRGQKSRARAISEALVFGLSIIFIYTLIGVLVSVFKNPSAVSAVNTHWIPNSLFFLIFIVLAASFFGMFELVLPSRFANKVDAQADRGGYAGAFFMAVAMTILSFSCTGPIVAGLLIKAAQGDVLEPILGMFGFSFVFAIPFTLFAIFPSWLKGLPKSGGWLNAVKVSIAFIMLAFSFYFVAKIDQSYHLGLLSREVFIGIWIVIFGLLGYYLLGKLKLPHDSDLQYISVPRLFIAIISFSFVMYLIPGLFGADLQSISALLPPKSAQNFTLTAAGPSNESAAASDSETMCGTASYSDFLHLPHGLKGYFHYEEALACAEELNKPVFVDFVGHTCSNCKKMYATVWNDPRVLELLSQEYVVVALYVDDKTTMPEDEWVTSEVDGKVKKTMGKINLDLQISKFNSNALPLYAIVDSQGNEMVDTYSYNPDPDDLVDYLERGLENYNDAN